MLRKIIMAIVPVVVLAALALPVTVAQASAVLPAADSGAGYLCDQGGSGGCANNPGTLAQVALSGGAVYYASLRGYVSAVNVWPWPGADDKYNLLYSGDPVITIGPQGSGNCIGGVATYGGYRVEPSGCSSSSYTYEQTWVLVGNWWVNVGVTIDNSGWYPYSGVMDSGCLSYGCKVWVGKSGPSHSSENNWYFS